MNAKEFVNNKLGDKNYTHSKYPMYREEIEKWLDEYCDQLGAQGVLAEPVPYWLTEEKITMARAIWHSHIEGSDDHMRVKAIRYLQRESDAAGYKIGFKKAMELFKNFCNKQK